MAHPFRRTLIFFGFAGALVLGGCSDGDEIEVTERSGPAKLGTSEPPVPAGQAPPTPSLDTPSAETPPSGYSDGSGIDDGYPDLSPPVLTPEAERGETGARNVLVNFARAVELREYGQAWRFFNDTAKAHWSEKRFDALFAGLRDISVSVPSGRMEGAAGSSYYTSQAEIAATDPDGRRIRLEGPIVLRRVNDVPGSSAEQRRWHIEQFDLSVRP